MNVQDSKERWHVFDNLLNANQIGIIKNYYKPKRPSTCIKKTDNGKLYLKSK